MLPAILLSALSVVLGALAFAWMFPKLLRREQKTGGVDLADVNLDEWAGLVAILLPRTLRAGWNLMVVCFFTLFLGLPHFATISMAATAGRWQDYVWYAVSLPWWLAMTGLPAIVVARHVAAQAYSAPT